MGRRALAIFLAAVTVLVLACGDDTTVGEPPGEPPTTEPEVDPPTADPAAEIMAAAAYQLVTVDHTFGAGPSPFTTLLVQTAIDPAAGTATDDPEADPRLLTSAERDAIEAALSPVATLVWIDDPDDYITEDLAPSIEGAAIIGLGEPTVEATTALAPVSMWCGGLCGTWLTYGLELDDDAAWTVTGIEGPVAIS